MPQGRVRLLVWKDMSTNSQLTKLHWKHLSEAKPCLTTVFNATANMKPIKKRTIAPPHCLIARMGDSFHLIELNHF
jgi:hypothetical protein